MSSMFHYTNSDGHKSAELGDVHGAAAAYERAMQRGGATHPAVPELAGYLALWRGDTTVAIRAFEQALSTLPEQANQSSHSDYTRAKVDLGLGRALRAVGRLAEARTVIERSLEEMRETNEGSTMLLQRRLYRARGEYALVLAATKSEPTKVRDLAAQAVDWYRRTGGAPAMLTELERLTGTATEDSR